VYDATEAKYNEVVKQLSAATITNSKLTKPTKLKGEIVAPELSKKNNTTEFDLGAVAIDYSLFIFGKTFESRRR
jgi:hypothetical protein